MCDQKLEKASLVEWKRVGVMDGDGDERDELR